MEDLNTDQNFLLLDCSKSGSFWKNWIRFLLTNDLAARRSSRNFSHNLEHDIFFAFFRQESFFERRRLTSLSIQGGVPRRLNVFIGMYLAERPRKRFFQRSQSTLMLVDLLGDRLQLFRARWRPCQSAC